MSLQPWLKVWKLPGELQVESALKNKRSLCLSMGHSSRDRHTCQEEGGLNQLPGFSLYLFYLDVVSLR